MDTAVVVDDVALGFEEGACDGAWVQYSRPPAGTTRHHGSPDARRNTFATA